MTRPRVLLGGIKHEGNSFVPGVVGADHFRRYYLLEGDAIFGPARGTGQEIDGIADVAREAGIDLVPTIDTFGWAAPPVADDFYHFVKAHILAGARRERDRLDGAILSLHGAMVTESLEDPEGDLIAALRDVLGPDRPIAVSFDMHAHLTARTVAPADAVAGFLTHPHVDYYQSGTRAMRMLAAALRGEARPVVAVRKLRMIGPAEHHNTNHGPMREVIERAREIAAEPGVLDATLFPTQPWLDVAELGWTALVVADGDRALAQRKADELARVAWERRDRFLAHKTPIDEAIRRVVASPGKPHILADSSDGVTAGSHGDGNHLLRALVGSGYPDTALLTLTDPAAVAACHAAGVGAALTLPVGGKLAPRFFSPVTVTGRVATLTDGTYLSILPPVPTNVGRIATLEVGGIAIVLTEHAAPTIDAEVYHKAGRDPRDFKIVQVKSASGFRAIYGPYAAGILELDATGPADSDLTRLPFERIPRPLWPFDPDLREPW